MATRTTDEVIALDRLDELWERCFLVSPLVVVGSVGDDGRQDFAPKHMATPLGWGPYFGFVCTPRHTTYRNVQARGEFTVSFPSPDQVLAASLAAAPRADDDTKPSLGALATFAADEVEGAFVGPGHLFLECELMRIVEGFGDNSLIAGRIVAAHAAAGALRDIDRDDQDLIAESPLLAYLHPGRFATIDRTYSFPFPTGFKR